MNPRPDPTYLTSLDAAVDLLLPRVDGPLHVAAPLGLGKPHRLLNALYARIEAEPVRALRLYTALSLDPPGAGKGLEARFLGPFLQRHFGDDFPRLRYVQALKRNALPAHIDVEEFYLQSGSLLHSPPAQQRYVSLNYTHVARALADRGVNVIVQKVARDPGAADNEGARLSLSCNTDLTADTVDAIVARGLPRPLLIAEVDPELPWLGGHAAVDAGYFDAVVTPAGPYPKLFGLPRQSVTDADYAIGFFASTLVRDGGTLQIGIGALADALCHALAMRHTDNGAYLRTLAALDPHFDRHRAVRASGELAPFRDGLYGCSEMINEGFKRLVEVGVIKRKVVEDMGIMQRDAAGTATAADRTVLERDGEFLHGAFYLGSPEFYDWLRGLPDDEHPHGIGMKRISEVNDLYNCQEALERLQRRHARFFNSAMMATVLGAAVSDGLENGHVVSGVGGQYNFVAMGHALPGARSVLMLRAVREAHGTASSNIVWNYGHTTIPRHMRDIYVSEYGIADVRGLADEDCILAMAGIADARFAAALVDTARKAGKVRQEAMPPPAASRNTPARLREALAPFRHDGTLPDYPLGSDFTEVEQRLVKALAWLKANTGGRAGKLRTVVRAIVGRGAADGAAMDRMQLVSPRGLGERLEARLLALGLRETAG